MHFNPVVDIYDLVDSGFDDFTFNNVDADGQPAVRQQSRAKETPPQKFNNSIEDELWAHHRAVDSITGGTRTYSWGPVRKLTHNGRIPIYEVDPDDNDDIEFELDATAAMSKPGYQFYSLRLMARWDSEMVYYLYLNEDFEVIYCSEPRDDGFMTLASR